VEYIKNLNSNYRVEQTLNTTNFLPESEGKGASAAQKPTGTTPAARTPQGEGTVKQ